MKDIIAEVFVPCLVDNGFYLDDENESLGREGISYTLASDKGRGYFWAYSHQNLFSVYVQDFVLYEDLFLAYKQPAYISINYYDSVSGEELEPSKRLACHCIKGHIGQKNVYRAVYHKNVPIRSTGIVIIPEYFEDYLTSNYPGDYRDLRSAFSRMDGEEDFPELVFLLRQIRNYRGTGLSAKLFYEGKVKEALSLIVEKSSLVSQPPFTKSLSSQDLDGLTAVTAYIDEQFASDLHLEQLARIACMGTTKLKYTFKQAYHCTITEYIQHRRMSHAEHLLANSDLYVNQIAQIVGYKNTGRFCGLFRKNTGMTPNEYRKHTHTKRTE
ncbi:AraC family transcriptional regulator [Xylanibacillus composti]|uniref:AraC family transcriptional regulator n=1 Tax=Xylanibacillus composti TaxID=1572762 RepID=A0A8J4M3N1_9BACL|nr:AraC family transcriptional regulator [Xylanibacillus composti]MDT9724561.1 AraC family transcriptional regulator [Xylanibacillus composti]GIQ70280.1 AraC family transcriptional regulator [Xylanibacillus composti]